MKRIFLACLLLAMTPLFAQTGAKNGEWPTYGGDLGNTRYSGLDQINAANFDKLEIAWRFKTDNLGPRPEANLEGTPLMVKGVLYSTAGTRRSVVALDAATGELLWVHGENEGKRGEAAPRQLSGRGLAYWTDGNPGSKDERIIYVTPGYQMVALDAKTGAKIAGFGKAGIVDLKQEDDQEIAELNPDIGLHSAPLVSGNTVIVGAAHKPGGVPASKTNVKGYVRGYDVRTGKRLWIFHTIPKPGEFGLNTWEQDSWSYTGNTGAWGQMSIDEQLGLAYIGVEMPTGDYFGGHRPGAGLFGESIVAVDLKTGARKWHYQYVHHGIWDMDNPCPPILTDIIVNGDLDRRIPGNLNISFAYVEGESLMMGIKNLAVSSGSACTSASLEPSYVLRALGVEEEMAHTSLRIGLGRFTTEHEVDTAVDELVHHVNKLREMSPLWEMAQEGIDIKSIEWAAH